MSDLMLDGSNTIPFSVGPEPIRYHPQVGGNLDNLDTTGHASHFPLDLELMTNELGINILRAPVPWHKIEETKGVFNWEWMDSYFEKCKNLGITPIVDLCHHSSMPDWIEGAFANPTFPWAFKHFVLKFAERYPEVKWYTLINEPVVTAALCAGPWHPNMPDCQFLMLKNIAKAICITSKALDELDQGIKFCHTDPAEGFIGTDWRSKKDADKFNNGERFLLLDLILGQIDKKHPSYKILIEKGLSKKDILWFSKKGKDGKKNATRIDILGLDFYSHNERLIEGADQTIKFEKKGLAPLFLDYYKRYKDKFPDMKYALTETNLRGSVQARTTWFKYIMWEVSLLKKLMADKFVFSSWYPLVDSKDWGAPEGKKPLLQEYNNDKDPVGMISLTQSNNRVMTEFTYWAMKYIKGEIKLSEIPTYTFDRNQFGEPQKIGRFHRMLKFFLLQQKQHKINEMGSLLVEA